MPKRIYQPSRRRRARRHGFRARTRGNQVLIRRRKKKRQRLTPLA